MKQFLLIITTVSCAHLLNAQIIIDQNDFPQPGDFYYQGLDTTVEAGISVGSSGANQTYDFSALETDILDTVDFEDPANLPAGSNFPNAFLAVEQFGGFGFAENNNGNIEIVGFSGDFSGFGLDITADFENPQTIYQIPANYLDAFTDTSLIEEKIPNDPPIFPSPIPGVSIDTIRFKRFMTTESVIDGYGSITGPTGTYDCLRQFNIEFSIDSIWIYTSFTGWLLAPGSGMFENPRVDTVYRYNYVTKELGYNFVSIRTTPGGEIEQAVFESDPAFCCTGVEDLIAESGVAVYPNPANGQINIEVESNEARTFELYNLTGVRMHSSAINRDLHRIDVSSLPAGIYIYQVADKNGHALHTGKLNILN